MAIKFIDTYSNGEFNPIKWKLEGYIGVIMKGGQGMLANIPRTNPTWQKEAHDAGLLTGWYWVCDSRYKSADHVSAMEQCGMLKDLGELGLWIDVEKPQISMSEPMYWKTPYAGHRNLVDLVYLLKLKKINPGIYTSPGMYALVCRDIGQKDKDYLAQCPLWTAQYYSGIKLLTPALDPRKPRLYGSWTKWTYWQWMESPDVNIFNGTDEEFWAYINQTPYEPPAHDPVVIDPIVVVPLPTQAFPRYAKLRHDHDIVGKSIMEQAGQPLWPLRPSQPIGVPSRVRALTPSQDDYCPMNCAWQNYAYQNLVMYLQDSRKLALPAAQTLAKRVFRALYRADAFQSNKRGTESSNAGWIRYDCVNGTHPEKDFVGLQPIWTGGNIVRVLGDKVSKGGTEYYPVECFNGSVPPPDIQQVNYKTHPHLFPWGTIETRKKIGKNDREVRPFSLAGVDRIPFFVIVRNDTKAYIAASRIKFVSDQEVLTNNPYD